VQADFDARYRVSDDARNFGDGPGVLPPPDAIVPVRAKGEEKARRAVVPQGNSASDPKNANRSSLRPIHRQ